MNHKGDCMSDARHFEHKDLIKPDLMFMNYPKFIGQQIGPFCDVQRNFPTSIHHIHHPTVKQYRKYWESCYIS